MKRTTTILFVALAVAAVLFVLLLNQQSGSNTVIYQESASDELPADRGGSTAPVDEPTQAGPLQTQLSSPPAPSDARAATVDRLADGDSFDIRWVDNNDRDEVRLFGINAPEGTACFGDESRAILQSLTADREVLVETIERDEFGRILANVWVDDVLVNMALVSQGAALALSGGGEHAQVIRAAQEQAQAAEFGLWDPAFCGEATSASLFIDDINANAPGQDHLNPNGEWIDIVNFGESEIDLTDWSIRDESTRHRYFFPDGAMIEAGAMVRVFSGCGDDDANSRYWCDGDPVWNNGGDTGFLVDPDGRFVDTFSYAGS